MSDQYPTMDPSNPYLMHQTSPDGTVRIDFGCNEGRMSHSINTPRVVYVPTGEVLLDLWHDTLWDGEAKFTDDGRIGLTLRKYPDGARLFHAVIDVEKRTCTFEDDPENWRPLAEFNAQLERRFKAPHSQKLERAATHIPPRRKKWFRWLLSIILFVVALNLVAYLHAYHMTHFTQGGIRTRRSMLPGFLDKVGVLIAGVNIPRPKDYRTPHVLGLSYDELRLLTPDGVHIAAWHIAAPQSKGSIILCHSYSGCMATVLDEAAVFHALGWDAWLLDMRGSGGSDGNETSLGYYEAIDVATVWRTVQTRGNEPIVVYGQSMGSVAALRAVAKEGMRPDGLILENPFNRMLTAVEDRFNNFGLPAFPFAELMVFWGGFQQGFWGFSHNPEEYAAAIRTPAVFMVGELDTDATPEQVERIAHAMPIPGIVKIFPSAAHQGLMRADPVRWRETAEKLLDQSASCTFIAPTTRCKSSSDN